MKQLEVWSQILTFTNERKTEEHPGGVLWITYKWLSLKDKDACFCIWPTLECIRAGVTLLLSL